ncbi:MAG TPA: hypothetical protein ENI63_01460 [Candidatus Kaiserbacteria bacterium]|nr:hypothetical protein [Candidatus Kaiserbacteria bacterium]
MENKLKLAKQIGNEITQFLTESVTITNNIKHSQSKLLNRISLFENQVYPSGKFDSQGNYKYWYDIITTRIESEIKNIDFDTKDINVYSQIKNDELPVLIVNLKLKEYLRETGQAEEINSAIEEGSGWGNIVWKKTKEGYERVDLRNFYVINQSARTLNETPAIERHQLTAQDMRAKRDVWNNVDAVLEECKTKTYKTTTGTQEKETTVPYYEVYERNGEISVADFKEYQGETPSKGDSDKYILAKVIGAGVKSTSSGADIKYIMFAEEIKNMPYEEYHRSRYKGRWFREGLYELLFDLQVRANQIGNQIAQGLELASKTVLRSTDKLIVQNILTDIRNGDIIRAKDLEQVQLRMDAFDQLANEWNRVINLANDIANSREIVMGITPASGTPLGTSKLLNQNAGKLFDFIREKLAIPYTRIFERSVVPKLIKELSQQEILRLTGDSDMLGRLHKVIVDDWYLQNLPLLPPHTPEIADNLKQEKLDELLQRPQLLMKATKDMFKRFKPRVSVVITGEQVNLDAELQTMMGFIKLEQDPVRRSAMIGVAMRKAGVDVGSLPQSPPQPIQPQPQPATQALPSKATA